MFLCVTILTLIALRASFHDLEFTGEGLIFSQSPVLVLLGTGWIWMRRVRGRAATTTSFLFFTSALTAALLEGGPGDAFSRGITATRLLRGRAFLLLFLLLSILWTSLVCRDSMRLAGGDRGGHVIIVFVFVYLG